MKYKRITNAERYCDSCLAKLGSKWSRPTMCHRCWYCVHKCKCPKPTHTRGHAPYIG